MRERAAPIQSSDEALHNHPAGPMRVFGSFAALPALACVVHSCRRSPLVQGTGDSPERRRNALDSARFRTMSSK